MLHVCRSEESCCNFEQYSSKSFHCDQNSKAQNVKQRFYSKANPETRMKNAKTDVTQQKRMASEVKRVVSFEFTALWACAVHVKRKSMEWKNTKYNSGEKSGVIQIKYFVIIFMLWIAFIAIKVNKTLTCFYFILCAWNYA